MNKLKRETKGTAKWTSTIETSNLRLRVARADLDKPLENLAADVGCRDRKVRGVGLLKQHRSQDADDDLLPLLANLGQGVIEGVQVGCRQQGRALQPRASKRKGCPETRQVVIADKQPRDHFGKKLGLEIVKK